jgi:hypothetical protein
MVLKATDPGPAPKAHRDTHDQPQADELALLSASVFGAAAFAQEPVQADPYKSADQERSDQERPDHADAAQSNTQLDKSTTSLKFDELDKNKDGFITKDEVPATVELSTSVVNCDNNPTDGSRRTNTRSTSR